MQSLLEKGPLLDAQGHLVEAGYSTSLIKTYQRNAISTSNFRIKEWDYYLIYNSNFGLALTIADNGYMGLLSVSILFFKEPKFITESFIIPLSWGRFRMPEDSSQGDIDVEYKGNSFRFLNDGHIRKLIIQCPQLPKSKKAFQAHISLSNPLRDSIVIATPFAESPNYFYYNQKIPGLIVEGNFEWGNQSFAFKSDDSVAIFDWGRGVWPYKNVWYWASAAGYHQNTPIGLNLGYGFGKNDFASENAIFWKGNLHKLDQVKFEISQNNKTYQYLKPWIVKDNAERLDLVFQPLLDRKDYINALVLKSDQHQVFGYYSGRIILDDGEEIRIEKLLGFAERVENWW